MLQCDTCGYKLVGAIPGEEEEWEGKDCVRDVTISLPRCIGKMLRIEKPEDLKPDFVDTGNVVKTLECDVCHRQIPFTKVLEKIYREGGICDMFKGSQHCKGRLRFAESLRLKSICDQCGREQNEHRAGENCLAILPSHVCEGVMVKQIIFDGADCAVPDDGAEFAQALANEFAKEGAKIPPLDRDIGTIGLMNEVSPVTEATLPGEPAASDDPERDLELLKPYVQVFGSLQSCSGLQFQDGRNIDLARFERGFLLRCFNPDNDEMWRSLHLVLSIEAMYAFFSIYAITRKSEGMAEDEALMFARLDEKSKKIFAPVIEAQAETDDSIQEEVSPIKIFRQKGVVVGFIVRQSYVPETRVYTSYVKYGCNYVWFEESADLDEINKRMRIKFGLESEEPEAV